MRSPRSGARRAEAAAWALSKGAGNAVRAAPSRSPATCAPKMEPIRPARIGRATPGLEIVFVTPEGF